MRLACLYSACSPKITMLLAIVALCRRNTKTHVEKVAGITSDKEREKLASMPSCSDAVGYEQHLIDGVPPW